MFRAELADEEQEETLIMDWQIDSEMASVNRDEVQRIVSGQLKTARTEIVGDVVAALKLQDRASKWWNSGWAIGLGSAIIAGLLILATNEVQSHRAKDRETQISDEITRQLDVRSVRDAENLNNRIATEVGKELTPIHQQIELLSQDIGKIKDHLHIAQVNPTVPPKSFTRQIETPLQAVKHPSLQDFAAMDQNTFTASLPLLNMELRDVADKRIAPSKGTFQLIANKLRRTNPNSHEYWPTVLRFLEAATASNSSKVPPPTAQVYIESINSRDMSLQGISDKLVVLNGGSLLNSTFFRCRIRFSGAPTELHNVVMVDSVVEFQGIADTPVEPIRRTAQMMLTMSDFSRIQL